MKKLVVWLFGVIFVLSGCVQDLTPKEDADKITVGVVQKEIRVGMSQAEVAAALGSPNLVSSSKDGVETWIYDKISSTSARESSVAGAGILIIGTTSSASSSSSSERTLTVIIKFKDGAVVDFSYRTTRF